MSQKDIEFCLGLDLAGLREHAGFRQIEQIHQSLVASYGDRSAEAA